MTDLSQRVTALEGDMAEMRQEWERQRHVPAAQTGLLNALRQTQLEHGRDISQLKADVAGLKTDMTVVKLALSGLDQKVTVMDQRLSSVERNVVALGHGMGTITAMLTTLIERDPPQPG